MIKPYDLINLEQRSKYGECEIVCKDKQQVHKPKRHSKGTFNAIWFEPSRS